MATNYPTSNQSFTDVSSGDVISSSTHNTIQASAPEANGVA